MKNIILKIEKIPFIGNIVSILIALLLIAKTRRFVIEINKKQVSDLNNISNNIEMMRKEIDRLNSSNEKLISLYSEVYDDLCTVRKKLDDMESSGLDSLKNKYVLENIRRTVPVLAKKVAEIKLEK